MAKIPRAGELIHTCEIIHRSVASKDDHGQPVYEDSIVASDWMFKIRQLTGRDVEYARQLYKEATYALQCRFSSLLYSGALVRVSTGKLFAVGHVFDLDERGVWNEVLASEVSPEEIKLNVVP